MYNTYFWIVVCKYRHTGRQKTRAWTGTLEMAFSGIGGDSNAVFQLCPAPFAASVSDKNHVRAKQMEADRKFQQKLCCKGNFSPGVLRQFFLKRQEMQRSFNEHDAGIKIHALLKCKSRVPCRDLENKRLVRLQSCTCC